MRSHPFSYLRLSITDRCDLQCSYCKPPGATVPGATQPLAVAEIAELVRACAENGITKVRLTGGDPLAREDVVEIARLVAGTPGITDVGLTTNGVNLAGVAPDLARACVQYLNISLDSLDRDTFCRITGRDSLDLVLEGMNAALDCSFRKIKINTVVMRGVNNTEVPAIAAVADRLPVEVRFIELMPLDHSRQVWQDLHMPASEIREMLGDASCLPREAGSSAVSYKLPGGGIVGIISPVSEAFCGDCNRIRITCEGKARPCLRLPIEEDLRPLLGRPDLTERLGRIFSRLASCKLSTDSTASPVEAGAMSTVGG